MNDLNKYQTAIASIRDEIKQLNQQIGAKETEISQTRQTFNETKAEVSILISRVNNIRKDIAFNGLSPDDSIQLKRQLAKKEEVLETLSQSLQELQASAEWLRGQASSKNQEITELRRRQAASMINDAIGQAAKAADEHIRNAVYCLLTDKKPYEKPDDIYQKIGLELCKVVFGERGAFHANLPEIFEARRKVDGILSDAA